MGPVVAAGPCPSATALLLPTSIPSFGSREIVAFGGAVANAGAVTVMICGGAVTLMNVVVVEVGLSLPLVLRAGLY